MSSALRNTATVADQVQVEVSRDEYLTAKSLLPSITSKYQRRMLQNVIDFYEDSQKKDLAANSDDEDSNTDTESRRSSSSNSDSDSSPDSTPDSSAASIPASDSSPDSVPDGSNEANVENAIVSEETIVEELSKKPIVSNLEEAMNIFMRLTGAVVEISKETGEFYVVPKPNLVSPKKPSVHLRQIRVLKRQRTGDADETPVRKYECLHAKMDHLRRQLF